MKNVIATLKKEIEAAKEEIRSEEYCINLLKESAKNASSADTRESIWMSIANRREELSVRRELLQNLRYSLMYAFRALGYNPTEIDSFEPEKFNC